MAAGFEIDPEPREPNEWNDVWPEGFARVKGLWVPNADVDIDGDTDDRVTFSIVERWTVDVPPAAHFADQGLWLAAYSYNGHSAEPDASDGRGNSRRDFDDVRHPTNPYHCHPFGEPDDLVRVPEDPVTLETALEDFRELIAQLVSDGVL